MPEYFYVANDYMATGEGRTISLLITRAYPRYDDYAVKPSEDNDYQGELKFPKDLLALREFAEVFDYYAAKGAKVYTREDFFKHYNDLVPNIVQKILDAEEGKIPGNFRYYQEFHVNYA